MRRKIAAFFIVGLLILVLVLRPASIAAGSSTLTIRPNAAGTFTGWTASVGSNWQCVDEEIPNNDTDCVYWTPSPSRQDSYDLQDHTTESGAISNVRVIIYAKLAAAGDDQITIQVVIAGTVYGGAVITPTTTYAQYTSDWPTNPQTGSAWTWSDIDALEAGFVCEKVGPTSPEHRVTQLYVEVTYTPLVVHDVAILSVTPSANMVHVGETVNVTVIAKNEGTETETFNVTAYYDSTAIETKTVSNLAAGANTTLTFSWNTTGIPLGTYTIKAEASVVPGETDTADNTLTDGTIMVVKAPMASFTYSPVTPRIGEIVTFNASDSTPDGGTIVSYDWDFGDGTNGTGMIVNHTYVTFGTYTVKLTITDSEGLTDSTTDTVKVYSPPVAIFSYSPSYPLVGETVTFNASASYDPDGTIVSWDWTFGDGTVGSGEIVTHAYTAVGDYIVTLTVTDNDTLTDTATDTVTVTKPPVASFTYSPLTPYTGETVTFNASASYDPDGYIVSYDWDFGDGTNGTGEITTHIYADDGTYRVTLNVTDNDGLSDTTSADVTVLNRPPIAIFTESTETVYTGEAITFNASASYDPDGSIVSYFWDFGDGTNATGVIVNHIYAHDGVYNVTLTVTDDDGATATAASTKTVLNRPPVASFTESAETVLTGEVITFNASGSYDPDGYIVSYFWDFGDGSNATGVVVEHAYADDGNYTVTLTVTDDDGATASTSATKTVLNRPPVAIFTQSATTVLTGEVIYFNASTSYDPDGYIVSYFWDFGDGTNASGVVVDHSYADDGNYTVTLTVTDDDGATDTATSTKTVLNRPPVASFTESAETVLTGEVVTFNASTSYDPDGTIVSYFWDFGDGTNATGVVVDHSYADNGNYTVTLTVSDDDGATASTSATKTILNRPPVAIFTESAETVYTSEAISFNASDSYDPDGYIASYFWDFGDGTNATGVIVEHTYAEDATYTVTLTVADDDGATASTSATKTVLNRPPVAIFTESAETVYTSEIIAFNASGSYDPDGSIVIYFWDFGDGTNATGVIVDHAYVDVGVYTVTLRVTDDDGATGINSATKTILNRAPVPSFTESAETVLTGEVITFNASESYDPDGVIVSYFWDFGDGTNATGVVVDHSYADDGVYTVTLTITDDDGATASTSATKSILNRSPVASFTYSPSVPPVNQTVTFNATASYDPDGSIVSYFWDFGDGTNGTGEIVTHVYATEGNYTVTLTVTDDDGATDTATDIVTVILVPPDVAVLSVEPSATEAYPTWVAPLNITVVVENQGPWTETFDVTAYYNETAIETKTVTLASGENTTLIFSWDVTGIAKGIYIIRAEASTLPGETDTGDNTLIDGTVLVKISGDVNGDGTVNVSDLGLLGLAWGSSFGDLNYDPRCDFNGDGVINVSDLGIMGLWWGYTAG